MMLDYKKYSFLTEILDLEQMNKGKTQIGNISQSYQL